MQALTLQTNLSESLAGQKLVKRNGTGLAPQSHEVSFKDMVEQASFTKEKPSVPQNEKRTAVASENETKTPKKENEKVSLSEKKPLEKTAELASYENVVPVENVLPEEIPELSLSFMQGQNFNESTVSEEISAETISLTQEVSLSSENIPVDQSLIENIVLGEEEISYLQKKSDDVDFASLVNEADTFIPQGEGEALLSEAQVLASENPEAFLDENSSEEVKVSEKNPDFRKTDVFAENVGENADSEKLVLEDEDLSRKISFTEDAPVARNVFTVTDERTVKPENVSEEKDSSNETGLKTEIVRTSENSVQMTMTLSENAEQNILSLNDQSAAATGSTFQEMLSEQIQQNAPDFVRAGNIALRDNNQGTINMILKPESLGNVKVSLQLSDKIITGEITVHSKEAMEAFKQNIESLKEAFVQSGYEDVQLSLNLSQNDSASFAQHDGQSEGEQMFLANRAYGDYAASETEVSAVSLQDYAALGEIGINMIA